MPRTFRPLSGVERRRRYSEKPPGPPQRSTKHSSEERSSTSCGIACERPLSFAAERQTKDFGAKTCSNGLASARAIGRPHKHSCTHVREMCYSYLYGKGPLERRQRDCEARKERTNPHLAVLRPRNPRKRSDSRASQCSPQRLVAKRLAGRRSRAERSKRRRARP
eukprot:scaffold2299_cov205-Pinguiococcus_pyrenoidosus.AAC.4